VIIILKFKDLPQEEKPRERLLLYGSNSLSTEELLMIILKTGTKKYSVKELANNLLTTIGGIENFKNLTINKLIEIEGIGKIKAIELLAIIELSKRITAPIKETEILTCTNPTNIINYFNYLFKDKLQEEFYCIYLDNKKKYLDKLKLFVGSINLSIVHPREVFKHAYLLSASFIICIHNHPSGDATPSKEDIILTAKLKEISNLHGIPLVDHIIIGKNNYYSFYEDKNVINN